MPASYGSAVFMNLDEFNETFDVEEDYFIGHLGNIEIKYRAMAGHSSKNL